jgi:hypothetical protein
VRYWIESSKYIFIEGKQTKNIERRKVYDFLFLLYLRYTVASFLYNRVIYGMHTQMYEVIFLVTVVRKVHTNMYPISNGYAIIAAWKLEPKERIIENM